MSCFQRLFTFAATPGVRGGFVSKTPLPRAYCSVGCFVVAIAAAGLVGCGTTMPQGKLEARRIDAYVMRASTDGLTVGCELVIEEASLQRLFARDLISRGVLPVMLTVQNDARGSVAIREHDVVLAAAGSAEERIKSQEQLAHSKPSVSTQAASALVGSLIGVPFGVIAVFVAQTDHERGEYDRQNRMAEIALRSTTLAPGRATTGMVYFTIDRSWLITAPTAVVVVAERLGDAKPIVVAVPIDAKLVDSIVRGIGR